MRKKLKISAIVVAAVLSCLVIVAIAIRAQKEANVLEQIQKFYQLPTTATIADLEKDGFVNLTDVQSQELKVVSNALFTPGQRRIFKTVSTDTEENDLIVRLFQRDDEEECIWLWSEHHVRGQYESACAGRSFQIAPDFVETEDGITEVWFRNRSPDDWPDLLLYRYETPD